MKNRIAKLANWLEDEKVDFVFINSVTNIYYYTGFTCKPYERLVGLFVFSEADPIMVCPKLEEEQVKQSGWSYGIISYQDSEDPWSKIKESLDRERINPASYAIEESVLSYKRSLKLQGLFPSAFIVPLDEVINQERLIKSEQEVEAMIDSSRIAEYGIEVGIQALREGITEIELVAHIEYKQKKKGIRHMAAPPMALFGKNSGHPHGKPGLRKLEEGDFVMLDLGVILNGYCSDITRTFVYHRVSNHKKEIYETVLEANQKAIESCKPGMTIGEIDRISRKVITEAGYGDYYPHRVGHGIGLEGHEYPSLHQNNDNVLREGMTFTIEPGIYIPEIGGVRIEDEILVTKDGYKLLTQYPKKLQVI
ncbi:putative dipeptidase YkvY [Thalassobacillus devorans]|uniref:Dipeptidase YkvY n=1 Tax=Thalassobacillus devorans TaxID=279813 RepID=A0ABQ1P2A5_9BACI|nr:Xaa-Pro peptidase family protein [Thalassobacillus devorans]NIK28215.1 Xaa-Pro dipeptidase [Thalassobacillus devorans]GGC87988.1 putative dipeptidase YkvY [Thalassobacillus devorans]